MRNIIKIFCISLVVLSAKFVYGENKEDSEISEVVLKPRIISADVSSVKYEINLEYLMPYLESVLIVEEPSLQTAKSSPPIIKKSYIKDGKLVVDSPYFQKGKILEGLKKLFTNKKQRNIVKQKDRYLVGLEQKSRKLAGQHDRVFVAGLAKDYYSQYVFVESNIPYYHPTTKEYLGTETLIIGKGRLIRRGELSLVEIEVAKSPIKIGTMVMPSRSLNLSDKILATVSNNKTPGYVLSVIPGLVGGGINNVAVINVGSRDNVKIGQLLKVKNANLILDDPYKENKQYNIPVEQSKGEIVIYDVFNKLSLGLIVKSVTDIKTLDQVE